MNPFGRRARLDVVHPSVASRGGNARFELVNFIDGSRTVTQIRDALSAQFGPVTISQVGHYLDDLVKVGVVEWK